MPLSLADQAALEKRRLKVRKLRAEGLTYEQVARRVGISRSAVRRDADDERVKRVCQQCGGPTKWNGKSGGTALRCHWCVKGVPRDQRPAQFGEKKQISPASEYGVKVPDDVERVVPPVIELKGRVPAYLLTTSYDCQGYACTKDALPGRMFCARHLDSMRKAG